MSKRNSFKVVSISNKQSSNQSRPSPGLPSDFFENVLDCEVKLKEKFIPKIFYDLINYYSSAISYYESINDPKYMIYNQSLTLLLSSPDAKKLMEGKNMAKEGKKEEIYKKLKLVEKKVTNDKVKNFIQHKSNSDSTKIAIDKLINSDMDKQLKSFKAKMAAKKKSFQLSTSDQKEIVEEEKEEKVENTENNEKNENNENNEKNEDAKSMKSEDFKIPEIEDLEMNEEKEDSQISDIDINFDDELLVDLAEIAKQNLEKEKNENNENSENNEYNENIEKIEKKEDLKENKKIEESSSNDNSNKANKRVIKKTKKSKFLEKMKENIDLYYGKYYEYFLNNTMNDIVKDYEENSVDIEKSCVDSGVNFLNQIKEMEYLMQSRDTDEDYKKEIVTIVQQLKEEQIAANDKLIKDFDSKMEKVNDKYIGSSLSNQISNALTLIKQKFKLDTINSVNSLVLK